MLRPKDDADYPGARAFDCFSPDKSQRSDQGRVMETLVLFGMESVSPNRTAESSLGLRLVC